MAARTTTTLPARRRRGAKAPRRRAETAAFTLSWDGRVLERPLPEEPGPSTGPLPEELCLTFRPCILGGMAAPTITGLGEDFLPRGIALDLLKLERTPDGFRARYRVKAR